MRFTKRRTAAVLALAAVPALGAGGIAIADRKDGERPATDRLTKTGYTNHEVWRQAKTCTGRDGPYVELLQRFEGSSDRESDPRISGKVYTRAWTVVRLTGVGIPGAPTTEPLGQTFGTLEIRDFDRPHRVKAEAKFAADVEADAPSTERDPTPPNPDTKPPNNQLRAEGFFIGRVYGHPIRSMPLNHGRMIANYAADAHANIQRAGPETHFELITGDRESGNTSPAGGGPAADPTEGRDDQGNLAELQKGDCGLGSDKAFDRLFGFEAPGHDKGHRGDDDDGKKAKGRAKGREKHKK